MKMLVVSILPCFLLFNCFAQKPEASVDILHYSFSVKLSDSNDKIEGQTKIKFKVIKETNSITLNLIKEGRERKGMVVASVLEGKQPLSFLHNDHLLKVSFDKNLPIGTEKEIEVIYSGIPIDGLIIGYNKFKRRGFFADHWPDRARNWLPCVDHPADKATLDFFVTAPDHFQVIANGVQMEEISLGNGQKLTHYSETTPLPTKVMTMGAADFAVQLAGMVDCIPVYSWVYPENKDQGFFDYAVATDVLPFFIKNVGPYPYKKLANVQSKTRFGGLENAGAIFYSESSVSGTRKSEGTIVHEIAHQWFGDMATEKEWAHVWLSEGFATYMTILYMESNYGKDTATKMLLQSRAQTIAYSKQRSRPVVDSSVTIYMELLNPNSYQKAGWVLHMLRLQLGDSTFWKSVRTYYARYAGKNANTEDLQKVFEEISGTKLSQFFKQWFYTPGQPKLEVAQTYDAAKKLLTLTITQQQETVFEFPLQIQLNGGAEDGVVTKSLPVKNKQTVLSIPMMEKPLKIIIDPNVRLLFEEVGIR